MLSPYYNEREDAFGGPLENRAPLLLDVIRAVKARTGADFPVWVRRDGEELRTPGGIELVDAAATARMAVEAGADAISMRAYATIDNGTAFTDAPLPQAPNAFVGYARAVRTAVGVPVIAWPILSALQSSVGTAQHTLESSNMTDRRNLSRSALARRATEIPCAAAVPSGSRRRH